MSHTIEYNRKVFVRPAGTLVPANEITIEHKTHENDFYVFVQMGDNNIYPRPRTWQLITSGWNYTVIQKICEAAGYTEGGGIQFVNGWTTPENYLKMYRAEIAKAESISKEALISGIGLTGFKIFIGKNDIQDYIQRRIESMKMKFEYVGKFLDNYDEYRLNFNTMDDFYTWMEFAWLGTETGGWHSINSTFNK